MARTRLNGKHVVDMELADSVGGGVHETYAEAAAAGVAGLGQLTTAMFDMSALALSASISDYRSAANNDAIVNYGMLLQEVADEAALRAAADASLATLVADEEAARISAIASADTRMAAEEAARAAGDSSLDTRLGAEEAARAAADSSIESRFSTAVLDEENARIGS